jgi:hypothetical protein
MTDFKTQLMAEIKDTPYFGALSHVVFIDGLLKSQPSMGYADFAFAYSIYSDDEIVAMGLLEKKESKEEILDSIQHVKKYLSNTMGAIASAQKGVVGANNVFDEFIEIHEDGYEAWADVLSELEAVVSKV